VGAATHACRVTRACDHRDKALTRQVGGLTVEPLARKMGAPRWYAIALALGVDLYVFGGEP
jgi:hypothetical protein